MSHRYVRLCHGVKDFGILLLEKEVIDNIEENSDYYQSIYYYNDDHYAAFQKSGTVKGIRDVVTNKLVFDFDNEANPDLAREEAKKLIFKLTEAGIKESNFEIFFSGNKGFNVVLNFDHWFKPEEVIALVEKYTKDLIVDRSLYDATQILRIAGTRHPKSGLFKIPLTFSEFFNMELVDIQDRATDLNNLTSNYSWEVCTPSFEFFDIPKKSVKELAKPIDYKLDLTKKPTHWKNCKWSLLQGNFGDSPGERHNALLVIAATCRGLGYDKESTYYLCKSALKKQSLRTGRDEFPKEELWKNIIEDTIFKDGWQGGQYSCKTDPWLKAFCDKMGEGGCKNREEEPSCIALNDMLTNFSRYASDFDQNIIKMGIAKELDDNVMFMTSTLCGVLGQPGAGKTSLAINYLKNTSMMDIQSIFLSLDMGLPIITAKLIQKINGCDFKTAMKIFKDSPEKAEEYSKLIKKEYANVGFSFKSGLTVPDIKNIIKEREDQIGKKVRLVVIDYLECIAGPYSDAIANTGFIANQLKDLANETGVCVLLLLQTQKHSTPEVSDPLLTLKGVKGSSLIEQSCSVILTLWREGYSPETVEDDRYISFAVVKNRFGTLWRGDFSWDGVRGNIGELTEEQRNELKSFKLRKIERKLETEAAHKEQWN